MKETQKIESTNLFPVVGIGASAGGLDAFRKFLKAIPEDSGMAYVLVQHLDPKHESILPELLQKVTSIPVLEISDEIKVMPNHIYVIPSNKMIVANDGILELTPRPENTKSNLNLPIDLFFASLAEIHQSHAIGVVLSGTGSDGTAGLKAIKENGGITFAQDEISATYTGMPNSAMQAGVVDFVLSPDEMPEKILYVVHKLNRVREGNKKTEEAEIFKKIIALLRIRKGTDFTYYKQTTIRRRILRRMALNKSEEPADYLAFLKENEAEQDILYQDMLIPVTAFFRDQSSFDQLCDIIFPQLLKNKLPGEPVRVWIAGCSTGEEAYSVAMCLSEFLKDDPEKVQIFATDLSERAIAKARAGIYSPSETENITPQRLKEFFTKTNGGYVVKKQIRDMCIFAVHNFLKDPAFGKIDLICCRNVLIYMDPYLQKKALTAFHYSLNSKGFLFLGKTETTSSVSDLYASAGKNSKLYSRKNVAGRFMHVASQRSEQTLSYTDPHFKPAPAHNDFQKAADEIVLNQYTPSGVVVNETLDIVYFRGNTSNYLEQAAGKPSHNVLKMAKHGLAFELRNILHKAKKEQAVVIKENISIQLDGVVCYISLEAIPLHNMIDPHYLILFHSHNLNGSKIVGHIKPGRSQDEKDFRIVQLEQELSRVHSDMRSITEDQEAVNEELQSDNEELLSTTEELQSLNEELETSKEELQSTNEELTVVNQEIVDLNEQVTEARNYAEAIVGTIREPLLILDKDLRVKTANSSYYRAFQVNEGETQGKLIYEVDNKQWNIPALRTLLENILPEKSTFRDFELVHTFSNIGERILLLNAREIRKEDDSEKLILLAFEDITEQRNAEEIQSQIQKRFQFIADAMPQKVWTADAVGNMDYFNKTWMDYSGLPFDSLKNWGWGNIIHPEDFEKNNRQWRHSIDTGNEFEIEERFLSKDGEYRWHLSRGLSCKDENGKILMWVGTNTEIQEHVLQKEDLEKSVANRTFELSEANKLLEGSNAELEKMNSELHSFTYVSSHDLQEPLRKIQTFVHLIDREKQNLSESGKDYLCRIQSAAQRMQQLIKDLLDFSHLNTADRKFEHTSLNLIIDEVKENLAEAIDEKQAIIKDDNLGSANIIPFQFRQLMHNLISNALKFSRQGSVPHIVISCKTEKHAALQNPKLQKLVVGKIYSHIVFKDDGIGFEPEFSDRIFEVFQKLHSKKEYAGTGIGLAIVKRIVNNHDGFITATSELGKGVTFDIYIPAD